MPDIDYFRLTTGFLEAHGMKILSACVILVAGYIVGGWVGRLFDKTLERKKLEPPVRLLLVRVARLLVLGLAALMAVQNLGFEIMPLVAGLGVVGVGIGLATQGVLSNVVAGLTIIFTKPFRVGEYIEVLGVYGEVVSIELFSTTLLHVDLSRVVIPNRKIVGEVLHNHGSQRQLKLTVGVAYSTDLKRALEIVQQTLKENQRVLSQPAPVVGVSALADSAISLSVRPWVNVKDFVPAEAEIYQSIVDRFRAHGISIPFPQHEVRVLGGGQVTAA